MPDMNEESFWECPSFADFSILVESERDPAKKYRVTYGNLSILFGGNNIAAEHGWVCTCPSYQNNNGPVKGPAGIRKCKHIIANEEKRCGWNQFLHGGDPVLVDGVYRCPTCNQKLKARRWAV